MATKYSKSLALRNGNGYIGEGRYWFERNDCSVIALAYAFDMPYLKAHEICAKAGRKDCNGFSLQSVLKVNHYKKSRQLFGRRVGYHGRPKMTVGRFQSTHPKGIFLLRVGGHVFTMIDGKLFNQNNKNDIISYYYRISAPIIPIKKALVETKAVDHILTKKSKYTIYSFSSLQIISICPINLNTFPFTSFTG